jgi:AraC-like DNA-binding protein
MLMSIESYLLLLGASIALSIGVVMTVVRDSHTDGALRAAIAALAVASAVYAMAIWPPTFEAPVWIRRFMWMLAASGVVVFWLATRLMLHACHETRHETRRAMRVAAALIVFAMVVPLAIGAVEPHARPAAVWVVKVAVIGLVVHVVMMLVSGYRSGARGPRHVRRFLLIGAGGAYVLFVLCAHAAGWRRAQPEVIATLLVGVQVLIKLGWLGFRIGGAPLREASLSASEAPGVVSVVRGSQPAVSGVAKAVVARNAADILRAMENDCLYRRPALTLGHLAEHTSLPEHRARAAIRQHLGFRNFATFVNHYRLLEAARRLRDPADAHLPILTVALEVGFASIGPFNRAFREHFGQTPTAYRRASPDELAEKSP